MDTVQAISEGAATRPKLLIIIASTRPGRVGLPIGEWIHHFATEHAGFAVEVADLAKIALPFMDEPNHPRLHQYTKQHTKDWSATVESADAFIFVTPEYNYGVIAPLKNAIDYLHAEWQHKPVGFVSYGGIAAGTRAVQMTKQIVTTLKMVPLFEAVNIAFVQQFINEEQQFQPNEIMEKATTLMLDELVRWEKTLRPMRKPTTKA